MSIANSFSNMPTAAKVGVVVATGGGVAGVMAFLPAGALWIMFIGAAVVATLAAAYGWFIKWRAKKRSKPLEQGLMASTSAAPTGLNDPAARARLDQLHRQLTDGISKFSAARGNLYVLPWYLLVGEPGSGKTEALRHCKFPSPSGLQDPMQGAGGTINMDWWFTNHAVILDTAGRYMFEQLEAGSTGEWQEFLKFLKTNRTRCPINGLVLAIGADTLIKDTADGIDSKAGKIAQQLDRIQRVLGVRFPVFVMITKCDLVNGFREFFDEIQDPQLQHQMLGWSNPSALDEPFRPDQVDQHLAQVAQRLRRRRMKLLMDPPEKMEDPNAPRLDKVDALYDLPDSLLRLGPRLRRYLELIFVSGPFSPKPLFIRGIYFSSSLRQGAALDITLAETLGMSVADLPEGRMWEPERAFFLRHLFMDKVFPEKGLVTKSDNTRSLLRRRSGLLYGMGFALAAVLTVASWFGARALNEGIGEQLEFWQNIQAGYAKNHLAELLPIVAPETRGSTVFTYNGDSPVTLRENPLIESTVGRVYHDVHLMSRQEIPVPWVFRIFSLGSDLFPKQRQNVHRQLFEQSMLRPLADAVRAKLSDPQTGAQWAQTPSGVSALAQMIRLEVQLAYGVGKIEGGLGEKDRVAISPLLEFITKTKLPAAGDERDVRLTQEQEQKLGEERTRLGGLLNDKGLSDAERKKHQADFDKVTADIRAMNLKWISSEAQQWLYSAYPASGDMPWPSESLRPGTERAKAAISGGVKLLIESWRQARPGSSGDLLGKLTRLTDGLAAFSKAEDELQALGKNPAPALSPDYVKLVTSADGWDGKFKALIAAEKSISLSMEELKSYFDANQNLQLEKLLSDAGVKILEDARGDLKIVKDALGPATAVVAEGAAAPATEDKSPFLRGVNKDLDTGWSVLEKFRDEKIASIRKTMEGVKAPLYLAKVSPTERGYSARFKMYQTVQAFVEMKMAAAGSGASLSDALAKVTTESEKVTGALGSLGPQNPDETMKQRFDAAGQVNQLVLDAAGRRHRTDLMKQLLEGLPDDPKGYRDRVTEMAKAAGMGPEKFDAVYGSAGLDEDSGKIYDIGFHSKVGKGLLVSLDAVGQGLGGAKPAAAAAASASAPGKSLFADEIQAMYDKKLPGMKKYADQYLQYWLVEVPQTRATYRRFDDWAKFRSSLDQLSTIQAFRINANLREVMTTARDATQGVPARFMTGESGDHTKSLEKLNDQLRVIAKPETHQMHDAAISKLRGLGASTEDAMKLLYAQTPDAFKRDYLSVYLDAPGFPAIDYWKGLTLSALDALTSENQRKVSAAIGRLKEERFRKFPLMLGGEAQAGTMTLADYNQAAALLRELPSSGPAAPAAGVKTLGAGAETGEKTIDTLLVKGRGGDLIKEKERAWLAKLAGVVEFLGDPQALTAQVDLMSDKLQSEQPAGPEAQGTLRLFTSNLITKFGVIKDVTRNKQQNYGEGRANVEMPVLPLYEEGPDGVRLQFFKQLTDAAPAQEIALAAPWGLVHALDKYAFTPGKDEKGDFARVCVVIDIEGKKFYAWISIRFKKAPPKAENWPVKADWP